MDNKKYLVMVYEPLCAASSSLGSQDQWPSVRVAELTVPALKAELKAQGSDKYQLMVQHADGQFRLTEDVLQQEGLRGMMVTYAMPEESSWWPDLGFSSSRMFIRGRLRGRAVSLRPQPGRRIPNDLTCMDGLHDLAGQNMA